MRKIQGKRPVSLVQVLQYAAMQAGMALIRTLPNDAAYGLGRFLGRVSRFDSRHWSISLNNIQIAFGNEMSGQEIDRILGESFTNLCLSGIETIKALRTPRRELAAKCEFIGLDNFREAIRRGKGVVAFTGHLGNWELCGSIFSQNISRVAALARNQPNPLINNAIIRYRQRMGIDLLPKRTPGTVVRSYLSSNSTVIFVADQYGGRKGVRVNFFGSATTAPKGPVVYALRTGAAVLPAFAVRCSDKPYHHKVFIEPPVEIERTGDIARDVEINTQKIINILESFIRRYPEQWLWMHRRWRR
jgi:KDO2-lipid IV(A) lauroyltransferase